MLHLNIPSLNTKRVLLIWQEEARKRPQSCKIMGVVCGDTFYSLSRARSRRNLDALINRSRRTPNIKTSLMTHGNAVIDYAIG